MTPTVVLIGLMGCGKSSVGRVVANHLGRRLVDSDVAIEERTGSSVRELWETGGEAAYRRMEFDVVLDGLREQPPVVIAAPGGAVLDQGVREALTSAFVVWLRADPGTLAARVRIGDHRPLLGNDPRAALARMASERAGLYGSAADLVIDIDGLDVDEVASLVLESIDHAATAGAHV